MDERKLVPQGVLEVAELVDHRLGPGLLWGDADQETAGPDRDRQGFDGKVERLGVLEDVVQGKVVADDVIRTCKCRLTNVSCTQKPYTEPNVQSSLFRLEERLFIRIDGGNTSLDRFPFVPITAATAPAIENVRPRFDPLCDEVTLRLIVAFPQLIHGT